MTTIPPTPPPAVPESDAGEAAGAGTDTGGLEAIFAQAAADRERFTRVAVEGNTKIAEFNEKPKI